MRRGFDVNGDKVDDIEIAADMEISVRGHKISPQATFDANKCVAQSSKGGTYFSEERRPLLTLFETR